MFKIATWNIDQARREEKFPETKFDVRWPRIRDQIAQCAASILCLQELRNLETSSVTVGAILYELSQLGYDYKHAYYGPDQTHFCLTTCFKRDRFFPVGLDLQLLPLADQTKPNQSQIVLSVQLRCSVTGRVIDVCNTHFGLDEEEKRRSATSLAAYLSEKQTAYVCAGDFNFFDDRDGTSHRQLLWGASQDLAFPLANASGTFMGYAHDEFKQPFERMSRLDHLFAKGLAKQCMANACGDMKQVQNRTYPSDHLMIAVNVEFQQPPQSGYHNLIVG